MAATELAQTGWQVDVLEARDRVGGRTWSPQLPNGAVVEMGAEFILPDNTEATRLADQLGLGLWDKGMRYGLREPRGGIGTSPDELALGVAEVGAALERLEGPRMAADLLAGLAISDGAREAIRARLEISCAAGADQVPATALRGLAHIGSDPAPSVAGGNQGLALGLAAKLGDAVGLGDPVIAVGWDADGVQVSTASGRVVLVEACVLAVPATVIGRIEFEPKLPPPVSAALAAVRYGHAAKLFVALSEPVSPSASMNVSERWWCWTATGEGDRPTPVVSCFAGSAAALERLELEAGYGRWLDSLARMRPELPLVAGEAVLSTWDDDPWAGAAYSIAPDPRIVGPLCEPVGPLAFAGEHLGGEFSALMEGAIRSGRRAAVTLDRSR